MNLHSEGYDLSVERDYSISTTFGKVYLGVAYSVDYTDKTTENKTRLFVDHIRRGGFKENITR